MARFRSRDNQKKVGFESNQQAHYYHYLYIIIITVFIIISHLRRPDRHFLNWFPTRPAA